MKTATVNRVTGRQYLIGCPAYCTEAPCGHVAVLVVGRATGRLEHLIVMPEHSTESRLVPMALAHPEGEAVRLHCSLDEFRGLQTSMDVRPMPPPDPGAPAALDDRHERTPASPYFGLGPGGPNAGLAAPEPALTPRMDYDDHVPPGEVRIYPGDSVHAMDGQVGHVRGVVTAREDATVTHILLDKGHLWTRKRVAIPMNLVGSVDDEGVWVRMTKRQIKELPAAEVGEPE